jgi:ArsR family transcriptional regulator
MTTLDHASDLLHLFGDTLDAHEHAEIAAAYGHVQAGFRPAALRRWLGKAGLTVEHCTVTAREKRPPHFDVVTAVARKPGRR